MRTTIDPIQALTGDEPREIEMAEDEARHGRSA
jgi:hypothetical protein